MAKKIIVIGSGFGGIAAALRLKAKGHKVTLIEKHPDLGGRARVFKRNGFTFDGGPTVITAPYLINELFELFQKDPKDYIKLSPLKVWYQFIFEDKSKFNYSDNENEMKTQKLFGMITHQVLQQRSGVIFLKQKTTRPRFVPHRAMSCPLFLFFLESFNL